MGGGGGGGSQASMRHLTNIFRRVYRIFAHAWFQHRGVFWQVEGHEGLYVFFKTVCDVYQLIPEDNYTIPSEAEGVDGEAMETPVERKSPEISRMSLLKKNGENGQSHEESETTTTVSTGATTRRHKHTPSTGSHVTTIAEGLEEEESSPKETEPKTLAEEAPRGRPTLSSEDMVTNGLGKLNLGDVGAPASNEQPTPQPQNVEKNPMDDFGKEDSSIPAAEAAAGAATGLGGDTEEADKKEETVPVAETDPPCEAGTKGVEEMGEGEQAEVQKEKQEVERSEEKAEEA
jgi:Mob1/phocein family